MNWPLLALLPLLLAPWMKTPAVPEAPWYEWRCRGPLRAFENEFSDFSAEISGFHKYAAKNGIDPQAYYYYAPLALWEGSLDFGSHLGRPTTVSSIRALDRAEGQPDSWKSLGFQSNDIRLSHRQETDLLWAKLNSKTVLIDPNAVPNVPLRRSGWQTEESLRLPFLGPFFVVGHVGADSASVEWQQYKLVGKTGVGWKLPTWLGGEIQVRGGRSVANYDSDTEMLVPEQMKRFVELTTRWPVADWLNLEYTGEATPGQTPMARDVLKHEIRFAFPLSNSGQFRIGAKYRSEDAGLQSTWHERMKMFLGLELKR